MLKRCLFLMMVLSLSMPLLLQAKSYKIEFYRPSGIFSEVQDKNLLIDMDSERNKVIISLGEDHYELSITHQSLTPRDDVRVTLARLQQKGMIFLATIFETRKDIWDEYSVSRGNLSFGKTEYGPGNAKTDFFIER